MKDKHIYIFNGPARTGKSVLASLINKTDSIVIVDDFIIPDERNLIIEEFDKRMPLKKIKSFEKIQL